MDARRRFLSAAIGGGKVMKKFYLKAPNLASLFI